MEVCKRRVAGVIFYMILTTNILCTELSCVVKTIPYEGCTSSGDYCFVKRSGWVNYAGEDLMTLVQINGSPSVEHCMEMCRRYLCSAFMFNSSFSCFIPPHACIFFPTIPDVVITEYPQLEFDVYIHTNKEEEHGETKPNCITSLTRKLEEPEKTGDELKIFRFKTICTATNQFSGENKIGEGGFGPVYKASLQDGQEVAVKRLSRSSSQGLGEFRNEIKLIARLQHINLVRLLGCCLEGNEKMLVYEFMPNKSLDSFLFDPTKKKLLDWRKRLEIIEGTAQGLLYLHKHSRVKVIHRDLKTSNILLDMNLKPKISDFGMARIFEQNTSEANTNRVVGTYGYMSPEYAMAGLYSEKSDVFSFGVIVLEIMSGKKATSFLGAEHPFNLIRYAWDLWKEDRSLELIDQTISETYNTEELLRHIHVSLLCVEENVADRPTTSGVLSMLTNSTIPLSDPKQPAFYCGKSKTNIVVQCENCSPNLLTLSPVEGR